MLDETLPMTLQYQLRSKLLEKMEQKCWTPGAKIPSERELCEEYGVSRMTVREVLKDLVQEGYLVRKQGKGTFVSLPKFEHEFTSSYSLSQEIEKEGLHSKFRMIGFQKKPASPFFQRLFRMEGNSEVYEITRLRYIDNELFAWEKASIPSNVMEGATEEELEQQGLYPTIFKLSGFMAEEAEVEAEAVNCPDDIANWLEIKKQTAVLHLTRLTKAQDRYIEFCESYIRSEKYKYKYRQTLRKKPMYDGTYSEQ